MLVEKSPVLDYSLFLLQFEHVLTLISESFDFSMT